MHYLSDLCNRLSIASLNRLKNVLVCNSKMVSNVLDSFYSLGFVIGFTIMCMKHVKVALKYINGEPVLRGAYSINKPSLKISLTKKSIQRYLLLNKSISNGFVLFSTSRGSSLDIECLFKGVGGVPLVAFY